MLRSHFTIIVLTTCLAALSGCSTAAMPADAASVDATAAGDATAQDAARADAGTALDCTGEPAAVPTEAPLFVACADVAATDDASRDVRNFAMLSHLFSASLVSTSMGDSFVGSSVEIAGDHAVPESAVEMAFTSPEIADRSTTFAGVTTAAERAPVSLEVCASIDARGHHRARLTTPRGVTDLRCALSDDAQSARGRCADYGWPAFDVYLTPDTSPSFLLSFLGEPPAEQVSAAIEPLRARPEIAAIEELSPGPIWAYRIDLRELASWSAVRAFVLDEVCPRDAAIRIDDDSAIGTEL